MTPTNMNEEPRDQDKVCDLDVAASYLNVIKDDLVGPSRDEIDSLMELYYQEETAPGRERYWETIRNVIRRLEGSMSQSASFKEVFVKYARLRFDSIWNSLDFNERSTIVSDYKFEKFGDPEIARPDFLASRRTAWIQTKQRIENVFGSFTAPERERINARTVDDAEVAFAMCEYVYAIDDYQGEYKHQEPLRLLSALIEAIRAVVFRLPKVMSVDEGTDESEEQSKPAADVSNVQEEEKNEPDSDADKESEDRSEVVDDGKGRSDDTSAEVDDVKEDDEESRDDDSDEDLNDEYDEEFDEDEDDEEQDSSLTSRAAANKPEGYYVIDEFAAENAKRAISFERYVKGSQTYEYRKEVDSARRVASDQKAKVDEKAGRRVDRVLERFERRLANWYNRRNTVEASCPSILIVGAANFPVAKHAKKMERLSALFSERDKIYSMLSQMEGIGTGGIRSDEPDALEKLEEKYRVECELHETMKRANAHLRRYGSWEGFEPAEFVEKAYDSKGEPTFFFLTNSNQELRRLENRIAIIKRQNATDYGEGWPFEGGVAKVNKEERRLQIFFDSTPDASVRKALKGRGFLWSHKNKAWQRQLTSDAIWAGKFLGYIPKDWKPTFIEGANE